MFAPCEYLPIDSWSFLPKMHILDILQIFRLDMGQINSNLLKKALMQHDSMPFLH